MLDAPKFHDMLQNNDQRLAEGETHTLCQMSPMCDDKVFFLLLPFVKETSDIVISFWIEGSFCKKKKKASRKQLINGNLVFI